MPADRTTEARVFVTPDLPADRFLPEGPREGVIDGRPVVGWVNIQTSPAATIGAVHLLFEDNGERRVAPVPGRPGFCLPTDRPNTVLVGATKTIGLLNVSTGKWEALAVIPDANPRTVINDGEPVPGGRAVVFGTKDTSFKDPIAELYLYTVADHKITKLAGGQICSNGKFFAADDPTVMYDIDTPQRRVTRYRLDVEERTLTDEGVAVDLAAEPAFPDGMCDAGDGTAVVALFNPEYAAAGRAVRYRLGTGEVMEEWTTPGSPRVTCPLLVKRSDGVKLILTTADEGMPPELRERCPNAGCLFVADTALQAAPKPVVMQVG